MSEVRSCKRMPNVNIPETEKIKLVWTHQKRRRKPSKKNDGHSCTGEEKKGAAQMEIAQQHPGRYEMTADMTENRQYWNMMVKTGPQRCGDGL